MLKTAKIAISLPKEDLEKIEKVRKKLGLERSAVIDKAIRFWLESAETEEKAKRYETGYKNKPEDINEIEAMEIESAHAFEEEDLK